MTFCLRGLLFLPFTDVSQVCVRFGFDSFVMTAPLSRRKWMPSPLRQRAIKFRQEDSEVQKKTLADVVEALVGLIYIEFGYDASVEVCRELGLALDFEDVMNDCLAADSSNKYLQEVVKAFSGYEGFRCPQLLEEAFTHPSAIRTTVSSYQRLEWIGDAVVCLCVREWLFRHCAEELHLRDLVLMEDALVSNETLALLSMKHGLPHFLNHRDQTLPGRMQSYFLRVQCGNGLWNTDPPKTVSDVFESLLGAIHMDGGFAAGQAAATNVLAPVCRIVNRARSNPATLLEIFTPPKRALQETTGELLDLMSLNEAAFISTFSDSTPVLYADRWDRPSNDGAGHISAVTLLEVLLVGVTDESLAISRNRACLILLRALDANPRLKQRLTACQSKIASGTTSNLVNTDGEDSSCSESEQK
jgi:dsRNA-specific ribonuclease